MIRGISRSPAASKVKRTLRIRQPLGLRDLGKVRAVVGAPLLLQELKENMHVVGGDRLAVREPRLGVEIEGDRGAVLGHLDGLGDEAIQRERLVEPARHQAFDGQIADAVGGDALDDERIEAVVGAERAENQPPALRRVRVHVGEVRKVRRLLRGAVKGNAVHRLGARGEAKSSSASASAAVGLCSIGAPGDCPLSTALRRFAAVLSHVSALGYGARRES